jgi:phosphoglycolate phosphatase-like HAD superfamily hydrolase
VGVVSFDLDGTLWEFGPMMDGALAAAIASLEHHHPELTGRLTVAELHRHRALVGSQMQGTLEELRRVSMRRALAAVGRDEPDLAAWLSDELLQARADVVGVHSDVGPVVDELLEHGRPGAGGGASGRRDLDTGAAARPGRPAVGSRCREPPGSVVVRTRPVQGYRCCHRASRR